MVDEPEHRAEIDAGAAATSTRRSASRTNPIPVEGRARAARPRVGGLRLPLVEADERGARAVRAVLERHGLLATAGAC